MDTIVKNPIGRPTKYDSSMIQQAKDYIAKCGREATELPTMEGLALELGVDDERIIDYAKKYPDFHAAVKELKYKQKNQLVNDGLYGGKDVNATMAIFLLKVNHGMIETEKKILMGGEDGQPIKIVVGRGFIPTNTIIDATPEDSVTRGQSSIQGNHLASQGTQNHNSHL